MALPGGFINVVVRVGETVRRPLSPRAHFVHRVLDHLGRQGWSGAPRFLGIDREGREMLSYLDGFVPWRLVDQPLVRGDASLRQLAVLLREFHDLTAGTELAGDQEVVCHNDLAPKNTVYRDAGPVAFIDWDLAAPGLRIHDVAHVCWQYLDLGPAVTDVDEAARRIRLICDSYGLSDRARLVETVLWWQDRCWRGIEAAAAAGEQAMIQLRDAGAVDEVRAAYDWVVRHRAVLGTRIG
jgi:hypothetical protein